jgi:hypothetical protein
MELVRLFDVRSNLRVLSVSIFYTEEGEYLAEVLDGGSQEMIGHGRTVEDVDSSQPKATVDDVIGALLRDSIASIQRPEERVYGINAIPLERNESDQSEKQR